MLDSGKSVYSALCPTMTRVVVRVRGYALAPCVAECGFLYTSLRAGQCLVAPMVGPLPAAGIDSYHRDGGLEWVLGTLSDTDCAVGAVREVAEASA